MTSLAARWASAWEAGGTPAPRPLLAVLGAGYRMAMAAREWLYRRRLLRASRLEVPVVSIGNLTVGGTGKTPAVELAVRSLLDLGHRPAVVSRGYRRRSRGVQVVADAVAIRLEPEDAGDEPFLLARRLPGVPVVVGTDRAAAARTAIARFGVTAIVLDDGFQHRRLRKDLEVVMARARRPWGNGRTLPEGPLRERLGALARADLIVAVGVPAPGDAPELLASVRRHAPTVPVVAARYAPVEAWEARGMRPLPLARLAGMRLVAFAGIAAPSAFRATLEQLGVTVVETVAFGDHHWYRPRDLAALEARAGAADVDGLVTTEKDWVRLRALPPLRRPCHVVSIRLDLGAGHEAWTSAFAQRCPPR